MSVPVSEKIKTIFSLAAKPRLLSALISFSHSGYLKDTGWIKSFNNMQPLGNDNKPVPWVTLPFIQLLNERLNSNFSVFEYGAGNSTLYFSGRVKKVVSVEHNRQWFDKLNGSLPGNTKLMFHQLDDEYPMLAQQTGEKFSIIFIDAEKRVECVKNSLTPLAEEGVVILDDTEREEYKEAFTFMKNAGFRHLTLWGISPGYLYHKATTIFYKNNNCFLI